MFVKYSMYPHQETSALNMKKSWMKVSREKKQKEKGCLIKKTAPES